MSSFKDFKKDVELLCYTNKKDFADNNYLLSDVDPVSYEDYLKIITMGYKIETAIKILNKMIYLSTSTHNTVSQIIYIIEQIKPHQIGRALK